MNVLVKCIIVLCAVASFLLADVQRVPGRDAMGCVRVQVPAEGFALVATPFISRDGSEQTIEEAFGRGLPGGSKIHVWDPAAESYMTFTFDSDSGQWVDAGDTPVGDVPLERALAVWFENPAKDPLELIITGRVPGTDHDTKPVDLPLGLSLIAFSYPVTINLAVDSLNLTPTDGDVIYFWDGTRYDSVSYLSWAGGWVDSLLQPVATVKAEVGGGFWYKSQDAKTWLQQRTYVWP